MKISAIPTIPKWWQFRKKKKHKQELAFAKLMEEALRYMEEVEAPYLKRLAEIWEPFRKLEDRSLPGKIATIKLDIK